MNEPLPTPDQQSQDSMNELLSLVPQLNPDGSIPLNPMSYLFTYVDARRKTLTILLTRSGLAMPSSITYTERQVARHIHELQQMLLIMRTLE